jgi:hypothetical protein
MTTSIPDRRRDIAPKPEGGTDDPYSLSKPKQHTNHQRTPPAHFIADASTTATKPQLTIVAITVLVRAQGEVN